MRVKHFIIGYIFFDLAAYLKKIVYFSTLEKGIPIYFNADSNYADRNSFLNKYQNSFYLVKFDKDKLLLQDFTNTKQVIIFAHTKTHQLLHINAMFPEQHSYKYNHLIIYGNKYDCQLINNNIFSAACVQSSSYWLTKEILSNGLDNYLENKYLNFIVSLASSPFKHQFIINKSYFFEDDIFSNNPADTKENISAYINIRIKKFIEFIKQIDSKDSQIIDFFNIVKQHDITSDLIVEKFPIFITQLLFLYIEKNIVEAAQNIILNHDLKAQLSNGLSPIHYAVEYKNYKILEYLLMQGFSPEVYIHEFGTAPLMIASQKSDMYAVNLLLNYNATPNIYNLFYETPFTIACKNQNFDIASLLIKFNAERFYNTPEWKSCLSVSVDLCNLQMIKGIFNISSNDQLIIENIYNESKKEEENLPFAIYIFYNINHRNILHIHNDIKIYDYQDFIDNLTNNYCLDGVSYQPNIIYCPVEFDIPSENYI